MGMANFKHGSPIMVDHTPSGAAVAAGDVIVTSGTARISHRVIADGELSALAASGGIYEVAGDAAITVDKKVYWVAASSKVSETAGANKVFGVTVSACSGDAALCLVRHDPAI